MSELENRLGLSTENKKESSIFGKGTFGRKLLFTLALITAGFAVGLSAGREFNSFARI